MIAIQPDGGDTRNDMTRSSSQSMVAEKIVVALGSFALLGGTITLVGWFVPVVRLTDWWGSGIAMLPNTAVAGTCAGAALMIRSLRRKWSRVTAGTLGGLVLLIGSLTLFEHLTGITLGIDTLLVEKPWGRGAAAPGRMGPPASLSFTLLGLALLLLNHGGRSRQAVPVLGLSVSAIAMLGLVGYVFGADPLFSIAKLTGIAMQTATMILALGMAVVAAVPDLEPGRTLQQKSAAGLLVRRALPFSIILPIVLGWLIITGRNVGWWDRGMGTALLVLALIGVFCGLLWWCAIALDAHEKASRQSEARFQMIADHISQLAWTADRLGTATWYNKQWYEFSGTTPEQMQGRGWEAIHHPDHIERVRSKLQQCLERGEAWEDTFPLRGRDGEYRWFLSRAVPIHDDAGKTVRWFGTNTDITERKLAEDALQQAQGELVQMNKELEQRVEQRTASLREAIGQMEEFSYSISHDLRAPLRGMKAYTVMLLQDFAACLPPEAQDYLQRISANADRLDKMILDLLMLSRVVRAEFQLEPVAVDKLVRQIVEHYPGMQAPQASIEIDPLPDVLGHEPSLTQALSNLLNNAVKFVPPNVTPRVRVWSEQSNGKVRFWVADNGIGIAPKYQRRLFNMFERMHPHLKYEGTGVGLAIVRKAVERMGGHVGVESDGVNGSQFWIELRRADACSSANQAAAHKSSE